MIQRSHPTREACPTCDRAPRHIETLGHSKHHLECVPCGLRTEKHGSVMLARAAWRAGMTVSIHKATRSALALALLLPAMASAATYCVIDTRTNTQFETREIRYHAVGAPRIVEFDSISTRPEGSIFGSSFEECR